jgi:hypothetical protein
MDKSSMFEQSRSLIAGAKIIIDSEGINDDGLKRKPTTPVILSCAFAIEVCLKLLLVEEAGEESQGHNLKILFEKLPSELLNRIFDHFLTQNLGETKDSLNTNLENHKKIFVNWRYAFESIDPLECSPSFLYSLAFSLNTFIQNNYEFERNNNGWLSVTNC